MTTTLPVRPMLSVVLPCHNESENIPRLLEVLIPELQRLCANDFEVIFVDDGSRDDSVRLITEAHARDERIKLLVLSRNFGHQAALSAGLEYATGRAVVFMDSDLQDPPEVIGQFLEQWRAGAQTVYAVRRTRKEGWFKRSAYSAFYRTLRFVADTNIPLDSGDFCLMDRVVVDAMLAMPEHHRFLRGIRSWVGFRQVAVPYDRPARFAGEAKYNFRALLKLAFSGYFGFSTMPLRVASWLGLGAALVGFAVAAWGITARLVGISIPPGWASTFSAILLVGGLQLMVLGIIGEYLGRIYDEVRKRPNFIVHRAIGVTPPGGRIARATPRLGIPRVPSRTPTHARDS